MWPLTEHRFDGKFPLKAIQFFCYSINRTLRLVKTILMQNLGVIVCNQI